MKTEEAIIYCDGFATIASAIPAYSKRGTLCLCKQLLPTFHQNSFGNNIGLPRKNVSMRSST